MSVFYDHLIGLDEIHNELLNHNLPSKDHYDLLHLADSTLHHEVLNVILVELPPHAHEYFLVEFNNRPDDLAHLEYLKRMSPQIEDKIKQTAASVKGRLIEEIRNHRTV